MLNLNFEEFQESNNFIKSYQENKIDFLDELYLQFQLRFEFEYQTRFSREFTIQYITMLYACECN